MKIKVYGSNTCPATMNFIRILTQNHIMPDFVNVTGSIGLLKEFITFRDTSPLFDSIRGSGSIGFPVIEFEDGTRSRDINGFLKKQGIGEEIYY